MIVTEMTLANAPASAGTREYEARTSLLLLLLPVVDVSP